MADRAWRDKLGLFFIEGEDAVAAATAAGAEPVELLVAGENVAPALLAQVASAGHPPRVIGVYRRDDLPPPRARPVALALWRLADPGNVGTLIRTADAFGAAVALSAGCADPTAPKALRASAGSIWRVPLGEFRTSEAGHYAVELTDHRADVLTRQHRRVALVAHGGEPFGELDLRGDTVFLLGAEWAGLPPTLERDVEATIPLAGAESLNVAAAGAIALYEWRRQNR